MPLCVLRRWFGVSGLTLTAAPHGREASKVAQSSFLKLRSASARAVWSWRITLARDGAALSSLEGPVGCDPGFCVDWNRFRMMRRFSACRPGEVPRVMRLIGYIADGAPGHVPVHLLLQSAAGFFWNEGSCAWDKEDGSI